MNRPNTGRSAGPGTSQTSWKEQYQFLEKKRTLEDVLQELKQEKLKNGELETLLDKACKEIKRYQDRFGLYHAIVEDDDNEGPVSNFTLKTLEPLLVAYEDNIIELRSILNLQSKEIFDLEVKAEKYVQENHSLRKELEKKCQQIINIYNDGEPEIANVYNRVLKEDQNEKIKILIEENHEVIRNYKELQGKYREVVGTDRKLKEELDTQVAQFNQLERQYDTLVKLNNEKDQKIQELNSLNQKFQNQITNWDIKFKNEEQDRIKYEHQSQQQSQTLQELQTQLQETKINMQNEIDELESTKRSLKKQNQEYENRLNIQADEINRSKDNLQKLEADLVKQEELNEDLKLNLENLEEQCQGFIKKDEFRQKKLQESLDELQKKKQEIDQYQIEQKRLQTSLDNINQQNEEEIENMKKDKDSMVDSIRSKCRQLLEQKDDEIDGLQQKTNSYEKQLSQLQKDYKKLSEQVQEKKKVDRNERVQIEHENQLLKRKLQEQETSYSSKFTKQQEAYVELELERHNLRRQNTNLEECVKDLRKKLDELRVKVTQTDMHNMELQEKIDQFERQLKFKY